MILTFIHGTQSIASQIINAVAFAQQIPDLIHNCFLDGYDETKLLIKQLMKGYMPKKQEEIMHSIYRLGAYTQRLISDTEISAIEDYIGHAVVSSHCHSFTRILFQESKLISGQDYRRMLCRDNSVVKLLPNKLNILFMVITRFLRLDIQGGTKFYCLGKALVPEFEYKEQCHITIVNKLDHWVAIPVDKLCDSCMYIKFAEENNGYVCEFPNRLDLY